MSLLAFDDRDLQRCGVAGRRSRPCTSRGTQNWWPSSSARRRSPGRSFCLHERPLRAATGRLRGEPPVELADWERFNKMQRFVSPDDARANALMRGRRMTWYTVWGCINLVVGRSTAKSTSRGAHGTANARPVQEFASPPSSGRILVQPEAAGGPRKTSGFGTSVNPKPPPFWDTTNCETSPVLGQLQ